MVSHVNNKISMLGLAGPNTKPLVPVYRKDTRDGNGLEGPCWVFLHEPAMKADEALMAAPMGRCANVIVEAEPSILDLDNTSIPHLSLEDNGGKVFQIEIAPNRYGNSFDTLTTIRLCKAF